MTGRYIRQKRDGMRDPTMTHVEDPSVFQVGHFVRDYKGWSTIAEIKENMFGDPMTRFIVLERSTRHADPAWLDSRLPSSGLHDLRPYDVENFAQPAYTTDGRPLIHFASLDEARAFYEQALRDHMTGFVE